MQTTKSIVEKTGDGYTYFNSFVTLLKSNMSTFAYLPACSPVCLKKLISILNMQRRRGR